MVEKRSINIITLKLSGLEILNLTCRLSLAGNHSKDILKIEFQMAGMVRMRSTVLFSL